MPSFHEPCWIIMPWPTRTECGILHNAVYGVFYFLGAGSAFGAYDFRPDPANGGWFMEKLKKIIREVPDFPKPGILFYDITTLLGDAEAFQNVIEIFAGRYEGRKPARIVAVDARGFIFGGALAHRLGVAFVPVRKKGKLPWQTVSASYQLEYGTDEVHMHKDAVQPGESVVIVDDLLATGGTAKATIELVQKCGGKVMECAFVIELDFLNGGEKLKPTPVFSILHYDK